MAVTHAAVKKPSLPLSRNLEIKVFASVSTFFLALFIELKQRQELSPVNLIAYSALPPIVLPESEKFTSAQKNTSIRKLLLIRHFLLKKIKLFLKAKKANTNVSTS